MKILYFFSDACGCCQKWKPVLDDLCTQYNVTYEAINADTNYDLKVKYGVHGLPMTLFLNDDEEEVGNIIGNMKKEFAKKCFDKYLLHK